MSDHDWWRGAIIYQIYPRSFFDANGDGVGDLSGIIEKLSYVASLGVEAIWISPFLKSPQADFGYDVSNYYEIDPLFGTLKEFDELITQAHQFNLKILMDMVINHTSSQHPWFQMSRQNKSNDKADWYVWADAKPDGSVPNNWLSVFGGSAWAWDEPRQQYYLHNFLTSQPDLNFRHPPVVDEMLTIMKFWLDKGIDGFRLDTVNFYVHDALLRDNPCRAEHDMPAEGAPAQNPYTRQFHLYDKSQPENFEVLKRIRQLMDEYPRTVTVGEVGDDHSIVTGSNYVKGRDHLHMVYNFHLLDAADNFDAEFMFNTIAEIERHIEDGWPCWAFSNHDVVRVATRFAKGSPSLPLNKLLFALLLSLRGTVCVYQGEELGLPESDVPFDKMQDPYGLRFYPDFKGRDGCRTPMPWDEKGGFSAANPWLPQDTVHLSLSVNRQSQDEHSMLQFVRQFIRWRKQKPVLQRGDIKLLMSLRGCLQFERRLNHERLWTAFNLTTERQWIDFPEGYEAIPVPGFSPPQMKEGGIELFPLSAFFAERLLC